MKEILIFNSVKCSLKLGYHKNGKLKITFISEEENEDEQLFLGQEIITCTSTSPDVTQNKNQIMLLNWHLDTPSPYEVLKKNGFLTNYFKEVNTASGKIVLVEPSEKLKYLITKKNNNKTIKNF